MSTLYYDQHAEAVMLGGPAACPFDCAACEARMNEHDHPAACGHTVTCGAESCLYEPGPFAPVVTCTACQPAPVPDTCTRDPWTDGIPF